MALLKKKTAELRDLRRIAERTAELAPATAAAIAAVEHDLVVRSNPDLRRQQERGEALRSRAHQARWRADKIELHLRHWVDSIRERHSEEGDDDTPGAADVGELREIRAMNDAMAELHRQRALTDAVGTTAARP